MTARRFATGVTGVIRAVRFFVVVVIRIVMSDECFEL